ncbi:MAG: hypothetical protein D6734_13040 [Candidatus Schekmanbacteria bacterium]|nr:MAG: hypothetical protein D6734_13040 [Candidatus Schekmanbacteria bacterium]
MCFLLLIFIITGCGREKGFTLKHPNILLVSVDTLRADHLKCYGYPFETSPFIDSIAERGALIKNAVSVSPSTLPSHTSLLTSLIPRKHGVVRNGYILSNNLLTLQKILKNEGFTTAAFVSSYALSSNFNFNQDFDLYDEKFDKNRYPGQQKIERAANKTTDAVIKYLKEYSAKKPFFIFLHYIDPHWPYSPPPNYSRLFNPSYRGNFDGGMKSIYSLRSKLAKGETVSDEDKKQAEALYDGEIRFVNDQFKKLFSELQSEEKLQHTIIVFTADHGETFFEHDGYLDHSPRVYETTIHIPLILYYEPKIKSGIKINKLVSNIDIAPTILELAGIKIPDEYEGKSFANLLVGENEKGSNREQLYVFSESTRKAPYLENGVNEYLLKAKNKWPNDPFAKSIRGRKWKYIETPYLGREEFYDIKNDPNERNNLINSNDNRIKSEIVRFRNLLDFYKKIYVPPAVKYIDRKSIENLKSLGYIN